MTGILSKEIKEGLRSYRFLIIAFAGLFFALSTPLIMKFLPQILKAQTGMEGIAEFLEINQTESVRSFLGDLAQILPIVTAFTVGGVLTREFTDQLMDMPLSKGMDLNTLYTAKWIVYCGFIALIALVSALVNFLYAGMVLGSDGIAGMALWRAAVMVASALVYYVSLHLMIETLVRKPYIASTLSLGLFFAQYGLLYLLPARLRFLVPHYLLAEGAALTETMRMEDWASLALAMIYVLLLHIIGRMVLDIRQPRWEARR